MSYELEHDVEFLHEPVEVRLRRLSANIREMMVSMGLLNISPIPEGMRQEFIDSLDRVPKKDLGKSEECAICATPFLDDPFPLVVTLPCAGHHRFDLECVSKWLKSSGTCPMCRHNFNKPKKNDVVVEEEIYDDMYG